MTWDKHSLDVHPQIADQVARLRSAQRPTDARAQLIHGDSNLLFHEELPPAVLDMSPYWRPAGFALGVMAADAIVWEEPMLAEIDAHIPLIDHIRRICG